MFLGMVVGFELHDGSHVEGRVVAVDEWHVFLIRTKDHKVPLSNIKRIDKFPPL
jgi:hypothetical protein